MAPERRTINLRLVHDGVQPGVALDEPLDFGLQDGNGAVHPGSAQPGGARHFDVVLEVRPGAAPVLRGPFAHGPPAGRFLYLSWKRRGEHEHPWGWRIKIPLSALTWAQIEAAEMPGHCLAADVTGRRPHAAQPVTWRVETLAPAG